MKVRTYKINQRMFCPNCHRQIVPPEFLKGGNVKAQGGIKLNCGYCKNGMVKILMEAA